MPILDAALAFAITMLLVATVVTRIVWVVQRFSSLRSDLFAQMFDDFYSNELEGVITREMNRLSGEVEEGVTAGLMTVAEKLDEADLLPPDVSKEELTSLPTTELIERLKRSHFGAEALRGLGDRAEDVFLALGERYDAVGEKYTQSFRRHSRKAATGVAFLLALVFNIDSLFLAGAFLGSEQARQTVFAQSEAIMGTYQSLATDLRSGDAEAVKAEDLERVIAEARDQAALLNLRSFPILFNDFPHANFIGGESRSRRQLTDGGDWVAWLVGVMLTALFAGLGAPFWYDTVTGLARAVQRDSA
ncbi:MAG: hypothetical protein AAGM22_22095 [Acidobacteriota bacterium]